MNKPFHLGLVMQGGAGWTGGAEYIKNLLLATVEAARNEEQALRVTVLAGGPIEPEWRIQFAAHAEVVELPRWPTFVERFLPTRRWILRSVLNRLNLDFLFPLTYENDWTLGLRFPLGSVLQNIRWAGWIPDFQHKHLPHLFGEKDLALRDTGISALAAEAEAIVFSSESAIQDYRTFWPAAKADPFLLRFSTVPNPEWFTGEPVTVQTQYGLPDRFFLVSNQFWLHKNHETVFAAVALLNERGVRTNIVCTGQLQDYRGQEHVAKLRKMLADSGIEAQVQLLGLVPRHDQIQLMRRSLAVIQPSLSEGWSTVVEDARLLGKPILVSDLAVHREQSHPQARYFAGRSANELADLMAGAWSEFACGPDLSSERTARKTAESARAEFGQRFLNFARGSNRTKSQTENRRL